MLVDITIDDSLGPEVVDHFLTGMDDLNHSSSSHAITLTDSLALEDLACPIALVLPSRLIGVSGSFIPSCNLQA
jgi:hypothetical protein